MVNPIQIGNHGSWGIYNPNKHLRLRETSECLVLIQDNTFVVKIDHLLFTVLGQQYHFVFGISDI